MLAKDLSAGGDDIKDVAQAYRQTQRSVGMTAFRALSNTDYSSHYKDIASSGSVKAAKFRELFW